MIQISKLNDSIFMTLNLVAKSALRKGLLIALLVGIFCELGFVQNFDKAKLDTYFEALASSNQFMGSIAVCQNGDIIYSKTIGFADIENNIRANENSKYRIGSITKTFTSVLVFKAVEDKQLDLNQTIDKFFPEIKNAEKISIKHLLQHRSGIHNFTNDMGYQTWHTESKTEEEMVEIIVKAGSDFEPDSKAEYSNSNFVLLSYILEKTYEKPYSDLLQEHIIQPLQLTNTYFGGKINSDSNECKSYSFAGSWTVEPETDLSIAIGAGGIVSTPQDLTKFSSALFGGKLLNWESLDSMKTINDGYGIGLFQIPFFDKVGYGHTGGIDGFTSIFSYFSEGDVSYALTSNGTKYDNNSISIAVLSAVYGLAYDIPTFTTYKVSPEDLDKYLGSYSSSQIPIKITITKDDKTLIAQATGQAAFPLEATEKDQFKYDQAGVIMEFNPEEGQMFLKQGGGQYTFTKD